MGRFANLELPDPKKRGPGVPATPLDAEPREEGRDEHYSLKQADDQYRAGRFERALRYYSRALEYDPNNHAGWVGQLRMLIEQGELVEARVWADKGLDVFRDNPEILAAKAVACARAGDGEKARAFCDLALSKPSSSWYLWLARGEILLADGQTGTAETCFGKAKAEAKADWFVSALVARLYVGYGEPARAQAWARQAVEKDAGKAFAWLVTGNVHEALGLFGAAASSYQRALSLDRDCPPAREGIARLQQRGFLANLLGRLKQLFRGG